ncbi:MAG: hypothetical protein QOI83_4332, partial [Streptomycetaceae bacterium]|nr:hypothetical protein [Streptomycetaceae bacterium]
MPFRTLLGQLADPRFLTPDACGAAGPTSGGSAQSEPAEVSRELAINTA